MSKQQPKSAKSQNLEALRENQTSDESSLPTAKIKGELVGPEKPAITLSDFVSLQAD